MFAHYAEPRERDDERAPVTASSALAGLWEVMPTLDECQRLRLAVVAEGRRVVFMLWPGQEQEADTMCCWRNAALQSARREYVA